MPRSVDSALALIESVKDYRVLFVGDTIIDEYHYVTPLAKSPKENLVPVRYDSHEVFRGGVEAAANHARTFCATVDISSHGRITRKVRMIDSTYMRKLFEVHYRDGIAIQHAWHDNYDVTILTDFGHGDLIKSERQLFCDSIGFLAVSAQTNSANVGYNLITQYPRADYIVIDEPEARLAAADRDSPIEEVIERLAIGRCSKFIVTRGTEGAIGFDGAHFARLPAMTKSVVDTMGAGDAFFAVTAPMAKTGSIEDLLLIGNAAGAMKCSIVGHRTSVTKPDLIAYLKALP